MAKRIHFKLFFISICLFCTQLLAFTGIVPSLATPLQSEPCTAPPPDSFHVTSRGPNFISVAWIPAFSGATQTLTVLTKVNSNTWIVFDTYYNIPGSSYTINGIDFEAECKLEIATDCSSGEPSTEISIIIDKIIVELTTAGRVPVNPQPISCTNIPIPTSSSEWIGFQVIRAGLIPQNIFEIKVIQVNPEFTRIQIKRAYENNVVLAVNEDGTAPPPTVDMKTNPFKIIMRTLYNDIFIGKLSVTKNSSFIDLCKFNSIPSWDNSFTFTVMKATMPNNMSTPPVFENNDWPDSARFLPTPCKISAESPFDETLRVFFNSQENWNSQSIKIKLLNIDGQTILEEKVQPPFEQFLFHVEGISSGIYILRIEDEDAIQTLKVMKVK